MEGLFQNEDDGFKELTDKLEKKCLIKSSKRIRRVKAIQRDPGMKGDTLSQTLNKMFEEDDGIELLTAFL